MSGFDRMKEINDLISKIDRTPNKDVENIESILKKKFEGVESCLYIKEPNKIHPGTIIRYVNLEITKVSVWGIVIRKTYYKKIYGTKSIVKNIVLWNKGLNIYWKINPTKYYIFQSIGIKTNPINDLLGDMFNENGQLKNKNELKDILDKKTILKIDDGGDYLFEQLELYKESFNKN